jgi:hypothetical protein
MGFSITSGSQRADSLRFIHDSLRSGGILRTLGKQSLESRHAVCDVEVHIDRDAVTIRPSQAVRLVQEQGFNVLRRDFLFFYPRLLKALRFTEPWMTALPMGAQYLVLCQRVV